MVVIRIQNIGTKHPDAGPALPADPLRAVPYSALFHILIICAKRVVSELQQVFSGR